MEATTYYSVQFKVQGKFKFLSGFTKAGKPQFSSFGDRLLFSGFGPAKEQAEYVGRWLTHNQVAWEFHRIFDGNGDFV